MTTCNQNYITRVIGVTRTFYWTITTGGEDVDLEGRDLTLMLVAGKGGETELEFTTEDNVLTFVWQGTDQTRCDTYSVVLWENYGEEGQRRVDIHNFVKLVPWVEGESGSYSDLTEETIDLGTANFTTRTGEVPDVVDNLESTSTTDALSANMGRVLNETKQDVIDDLDEIREGAALGATAVQTETDPVFTASAAAGIAASDIATWNAKQAALTFDTTPTSGSTNPVTSGGVYTAVSANTSAIQTNATNIATNASAITALTTRVTTLESTVGDINTILETINYGS